MQAAFVVEGKVVPQAGEEFHAGGKLVQVNQLVLDAPPEPFDEDVVQGTAAAIHADLDIVVEQRLEECLGSELRALVGVLDLGLIVTLERGVQRSGAKSSL